MNKYQTVAFFDFDGTVTKKDTMIGFLIFSFGYLRFFFALIILAPMFLLYLLRFIPNHKAKQILLSYFFKDMHLKDFNHLARNYCLTKIEKIIQQKAMKRIIWHKNNGHLIVIVTASISNWVKPWCDKHKIELIATELQIKDDIVTGLFSTNNCYGKEKVKRIKEKFDLSSFSSIYAYGDSEGDKDMLNIAHNKYYRTFS